MREYVTGWTTLYGTLLTFCPRGIHLAEHNSKSETCNFKLPREVDGPAREPAQPGNQPRAAASLLSSWGQIHEGDNRMLSVMLCGVSGWLVEEAIFGNIFFKSAFDHMRKQQLDTKTLPKKKQTKKELLFLCNTHWCCCCCCCCQTVVGNYFRKHTNYDSRQKCIHVKLLLSIWAGENSISKCGFIDW